MDHYNLRSVKKAREDSEHSTLPPLSGDALLNAMPAPPPIAATAPATVTMAMLPTVALSYIASFGGNLSGACKSTLEAIPELHYKISFIERAESFSIAEDPAGVLSTEHMGLQPSGALATGRVVTQITVTGCTAYSDPQVKVLDERVAGCVFFWYAWLHSANSPPIVSQPSNLHHYYPSPSTPSSKLVGVAFSQRGYQILEKAVQRVVEHALPTLSSITVAGRKGKDSGRVAAIIGALVPNHPKGHRVAPRLTRVELRHGANGIVKVGNAIGARLWPALEELIVPNCHGNKGHFSGLSKALSEGSAPNLRVLFWGNQSCTDDEVDDSMLRALSAGKCPRVERISFTGYLYGSKSTLELLVGTLQSCPNLRELRMDCTNSPGKQLRDLTSALQDGCVPRLRFLSVRITCLHNQAFGPSVGEDVKALKRAASLRSSPLCLEVN